MLTDSNVAPMLRAISVLDDISGAKWMEGVIRRRYAELVAEHGEERALWASVQPPPSLTYWALARDRMHAEARRRAEARDAKKQRKRDVERAVRVASAEKAPIIRGS